LVIDCPNCGANVRHDGRGEHARCTFCGTQFVLPVRRSRTELELERDQLLARESERAQQIKEANARGMEDYLLPPIGCCGIYFGLFVLGSMLLGAIGVKASEKYGTAVAAISIGAALIGVVLIIWRRERKRTQRVVALEREWTTDRELRQKRLREIEAELEALET
jgi:DNA-directed RNA polymerase subunit RPC12/RpoP